MFGQGEAGIGCRAVCLHHASPTLRRSGARTMPDRSFCNAAFNGRRHHLAGKMDQTAAGGRAGVFAQFALAVQPSETLPERAPRLPLRRSRAIAV
jgi:hypothetical protein